MATQNLFDRLRDLFPEVGVRHDQPEHEARRRTLAILMSVVVAFVLWFTFSMRESYSVVIEMPIVVENVPEGRALGSSPPAEARVTVQGEGWELLKIRRSPPALAVRSTDETINVLSSASESSRLPPGVVVQSVVPTTLTLDLEPRITRTLPVRLTYDVEAAELYDFTGEPTVVPDTVRVSGARSIINGLQAWPTAPLERSDVTRGFVADLALSDTLAGLVDTEVDRVRVTVSVGLFTEATRELEVRTEGAPPGADPIRLIPSRVSATYRVPVDQYERSLGTPDFYAFVPYAAAINDTTGTLQPVLHLPEDLVIRDARFEPRRLQYRIRVE